MFLKYIVSLHTYQYNYIAYTKQELKLQDLKKREKTTSKIKKRKLAKDSGIHLWSQYSGS